MKLKFKKLSKNITKIKEDFPVTTAAVASTGDDKSVVYDPKKLKRKILVRRVELN
jgi:hypothetical protein